MNIQTLFPYLLILLTSTLSFSDQVIIDKKWDKGFYWKQIETGEILAINGVFSNSSAIYLHDLATRSIHCFSHSGTFLRTIPLTSIGRNTYTGDDFIVFEKEFVFLNTVDKTLECFDLETGHFRRSISYPVDIFSHEKQGRFRIIHKIFLHKGRIVLGNSYNFLFFDIHTRSNQPISASLFGNNNRDRKLILVDKEMVLFSKKEHEYTFQNIHRNKKGMTGGSDTFDFSQFHFFPLTGKSFFVQGNDLYSLDVNKTGFTVTKINTLKN